MAYRGRNNYGTRSQHNRFNNSNQYPMGQWVPGAGGPTGGNRNMNYPAGANGNNFDNTANLYPSQQTEDCKQEAPMEEVAPSVPFQEDAITKSDDDMKGIQNDEEFLQEGQAKPHWMKSKLQGVKKISNKERRRRQNETLRRLLTPKNALMLLNELHPGEQINNNFKVDLVTASGVYNSSQATSFSALLTMGGNTYKGYGENKLASRNAAAEQAVRDIMLRHMAKALNNEPGAEGSSEGEEETLPMIQLASFALHKLFSEWEYEGLKVPQMKPNPAQASLAKGDDASVSTPAKTKKPRELPENAAEMHPCILLTQMRPDAEYKEIGVEGDRQQNTVFVMGVDVDGVSYTGKAPNKKAARKNAAAAACNALFNVTFTNA